MNKSENSKVSSSEQEKAELEASIIKNGCFDSIIEWHSTIVDGHNRYDIGKKHGINAICLGHIAGSQGTYFWRTGDDEFGSGGLIDQTRLDAAFKQSRRFFRIDYTIAEIQHVISRGQTDT